MRLPPKQHQQDDALLHHLTGRDRNRMSERDHLVEVDGEIKFQSDKYPGTPAGKVPLSTTDPDARDILWIYAHRHKARDPGFSADLLTALHVDGYDGPTPQQMVEFADDWAAIAAGKG